MCDVTKYLDNPKEEIVYHGNRFTVARVTGEVEGKHFVGEGVSRRSYLDRQNENLARSIAIGRARKAILMKLSGKKPRHLLMG